MKLRAGPKSALSIFTVALLLGSVAGPASAGPVATNDQEYANLERVFPEISKSNTYTLYTSEFVPAIHYLETLYPDRIRIWSYGKSVQDRDLYAIELTDKTSNVPYQQRKTIPIDVAIHGNERAPAEGALRFLEDMASTKDPELVKLLGTTRVLFTFPNPDGWAVRMETLTPYGLRAGTRANANNVDMNRQWPSIGYVNSQWRTLGEPEVQATYELYESPEYRDGRWGHSLHCFTIYPQSYVQLLLSAAQNDVVDHVQTLDFVNRVVEEIGDATAGLEFNSQDWLPVMYGTVWETRRRLNTGFMGGYLAQPEPVGHERLGITFEFQGCEGGNFNRAVQEYHVEAIRAGLKVVMEVANQPDPKVRVQLPGNVGYLFDPETVRHDDDNGPGYEPANEFEANFEQLPYEASRMGFFTDLAKHTPRLVQVPSGRANAPAGLRGLDTFVITEHDGGIDPARLATFVESGGTLVLADGAVRTLAKITDIPAEAITRQRPNPGTDIPRMAAPHSAPPPTTGESRDFNHPLLAGLDQPEAYAEQLYEPVPLGFSLDAGAAPWWGVDASLFEAAGGRIAALDQRGTVMLGDLTVGDGRIVVIGGLLPQPTEDYFHPYGLADHSVTHVGYQVFLNAIGGTLEVQRQ